MATFVFYPSNFWTAERLKAGIDTLLAERGYPAPDDSEIYGKRVYMWQPATYFISLWEKPGLVTVITHVSIPDKRLQILHQTFLSWQADQHHARF